MFSINLDKAKEIWLNMYRISRAPILKKLDSEYIRALELDDLEQIELIKNKKRMLRDITNTDLSEIKNPEELKKLWPFDLLGNPPFNL